VIGGRLSIATVTFRRYRKQKHFNHNLELGVIVTKC